MAYNLNNPQKELVLLNLHTNREQRFTGIADYAFDKNGRFLLLKMFQQREKNSEESLQWVDLKKGITKTIWPADKSSNNLTIGNYTFDGSGSQLAFMVQGQIKGSAINNIWYYKADMEKATMVVQERSAGIDSGTSIKNSPPSFSLSGNYIFFRLSPLADPRKPDPKAVELDVWSYRDSILQSKQLAKSFWIPEVEITAVVNPRNGRINTIVDKIELPNFTPSSKSDFVVVENNKYTDEYWLAGRKSYLVSLEDGSRKLLDSTYSYNSYFFLLVAHTSYIITVKRKPTLVTNYLLVNKSIFQSIFPFHLVEKPSECVVGQLNIVRYLSALRVGYRMTRHYSCMMPMIYGKLILQVLYRLSTLPTDMVKSTK